MREPGEGGPSWCESAGGGPAGGGPAGGESAGGGPVGGRLAGGRLAGGGLAGWWHEAVRELGGTHDPGDLADRYAEPHRGYHDTDHALAVVRDVNALAEADHRTAREKAVLTLAALAHDVVYDGKPGDDERRSAEWVRERLAGLPEADEVARLVLATVNHASDDPLTCLLLDADLAVLGSDPATYERYRTAVRTEYAHVPDDAWRVGRAGVLRSLAARDPLFVTPHARERWEARAKANLAAEISLLGDPP